LARCCHRPPRAGSGAIPGRMGLLACLPVVPIERAKVTANQMSDVGPHRGVFSCPPPLHRPGCLLPPPPRPLATGRRCPADAPAVGCPPTPPLRPGSWLPSISLRRLHQPRPHATGPHHRCPPAAGHRAPPPSPPRLLATGRQPPPFSPPRRLAASPYPQTPPPAPTAGPHRRPPQPAPTAGFRRRRPPSGPAVASWALAAALRRRPLPGPGAACVVFESAGRRSVTTKENLTLDRDLHLGLS